MHCASHAPSRIPACLDGDRRRKGLVIRHAAGQIAQTLGSIPENSKKALNLPKGCRLVEYGSSVRIVSRDHAVAKVAVGSGPNPVLGYMPVQRITNATGDPID
jgi:hypothetical protein